MDGHLGAKLEMRACGDIGAANEKSVPTKSVRTGGEVQCAKDRWLVHACTDTRSGCGVGGWLCEVLERWTPVEEWTPEDYKRDVGGGI